MSSYGLTVQLSSLDDPITLKILKFLCQEGVSFNFGTPDDGSYFDYIEDIRYMLTETPEHEILGYLPKGDIEYASEDLMDREDDEDNERDPNEKDILCLGPCKVKFHPLTLARRGGRCLKCAKLEKA